MPDDNAELANVEIQFQRLQPDTPDSCPVPLDDVVAYLRLESPDYESVEASQLTFLRTALLADHRYWIWSFQESDGSDCFVTVSQSPDGTTCTGYEENYYGLTPEQFMLGDYHQVF
jgi:hypothetical protein